ncbi:hypothetical protein BC939DRAFT_455010 [Gamsiella multidivaricata]|uniref:uncharacterized protein n=1 Tax=Gamsiella multidivaricata TaxID=101098 RepID=UPI00221E49F2|nr:uncharacterized protein BC939DRAFT_455010 [Gamsiella multidivaricata]KAI7821950.1 hypothetical protein BC939DRAFT_455010 [Gamsiella multidivaricata]
MIHMFERLAKSRRWVCTVSNLPDGVGDKIISDVRRGYSWASIDSPKFMFIHIHHVA